MRRGPRNGAPGTTRIKPVIAIAGKALAQGEAHGQAWCATQPPAS
jgi:hypothetical protein